MVTSQPDGPPATIVTVTNDATINGGGNQSGAPRASPEVTDIDPTASPKRFSGGVLRVPSVSNGWGEPAGGNEVSCETVLTSLRLMERKGRNDLQKGYPFCALQSM